MSPVIHHNEMDPTEVLRFIDEGCHFLFVAKPGDHKYMFEWLDDFPEIPSYQFVDEKDCTHYYRWKNEMPLHGGDNSIKVNFF